MTFPASVANLTKAVNEITAETNVPKSTLDAKVAQAEAEVPLAQAEQTAAEGYRDTAATHAADAATHLATVQANVTYDGIEAILAEKAVTAVDVFVYDTSLDSDGGAWRKRCQHTSWYNEELNTATRGSRREFPAVAVIVAEASKVTIYDGDDPSLPMWMTFAVYTNYVNTMITGGNDPRTVRACALNAKLVVGTQNEAAGNTGTNGLFIVDFIADQGRKIGSNADKIYKGTIADRNSTVGNDYLNDPSTGDARLGSTSVYSVDVAVLPDAPSDPATGLPVPTILAVCGRSDIVHGISVLKDDGTVVDLVNYVSQPARAAFVEVGGETKIFTTSRYNNWIGVFDIPDADFNTWAYLWGFQHGGGVTWFGQRFADTNEHLVVGANNGLVLFNKDEKLINLQGAVTANRWQQMSAVIASGYATGWLPGDIKGAFLADTDDTDLVGSGELVTNGDFGTGDLTGWTDSSDGTGTATVNGSNQLELYRLDASNRGIVTQNITFTGGSLYVVTFTKIDSSTIVQCKAGHSNPDSAVILGQVQAAGHYSFTFSSTQYLHFLNVSNATTAVIDNISVKLADADRSVNNKGLIVNGTITRSPVADGAELVGYSGFSAANYLEQHYNSALDFGTGDFCVMGWASCVSTSAQCLLHRGDGDATGWGVGSIIQIEMSTNLKAGVYTSGFADQSESISFSGTSFANGQMRFVCLARKAGVLRLYVDGLEVGSVASDIDATNTSASLWLGQRPFSSRPWSSGSLALWRISATAPTPDQIKKIYEDERKLFQPGAQCTLYGTSDAVTALAHDPKTNLLHVGTSAGRSTFDGLVRVANTTTPVGTAISAVNGLIVEE